ncbi:family 16 glycosylhydrolase [Vibrio astriarenae]|uniref:Family 16 glycosylhydrolase n=1 Tax=Vibrio astriarenae TaxID=1481923 RepID=A0A7Z2T7C9_9VIBR|nr:Ig-like domain-containing protein [Vibrio astriarenae]QIA65625.1 family 16 glycosylhydrolase [Vibrio astriarenae]
MKLRYLLLSTLAVAISSANASVVRPTGFHPGEVRWQELGDKSDDFTSGSLNPGKWVNAPASLNVGAWTFDPANTYVQDGNLVIETTQDTHIRRFADSCWDGVAGGPPQFVDREFYYKSGAVHSIAKGVYGFYEAKIKGVEIFPGLSPAFWLYSDDHPYDDRNDPTKQYVDYSEIDIVELQQADWRSPTDFDDQYDMDHNLHARVEENGQIVWKRPKPNPEAQLLHYRAPFDPRLDFHTYAVENRPDRITWYVDGVEVGSKPNKWWHRPMRVTFSQGLRRHLIKYNPDCQRADPNPDNIISEGFPEKARMKVNYVKTWKALPSVWVEDQDKYTGTEYPNSKPLDVSVNYHGGSDFYVESGNYNGVTVNLVEKNASGVVQVIRSSNDPSTTSDANKYAGKTTLSLDLSGVTPSNQLPNGHYYALAPVFSSSNGNPVYAQSPIEPIKITGNGDSNDVPVTGVELTPQTASVKVNETVKLTSTVKPYNASDKGVYYYSDNSNIASVNNSGVVTGKVKGTTNITVTTNDGAYTSQSVVNVIDNSGGWTPVTGVEVSPSSLSLSLGQTKLLNVSVLPSHASNQSVTFQSNNPSVAIVNGQGQVTAKGKGTAQVTVKTKNGGFTDSVTITVK